MRAEYGSAGPPCPALVQCGRRCDAADPKPIRRRRSNPLTGRIDSAMLQSPLLQRAALQRPSASGFAAGRKWASRNRGEIVARLTRPAGLSPAPKPGHTATLSPKIGWIQRLARDDRPPSPLSTGDTTSSSGVPGDHKSLTKLARRFTLTLQPVRRIAAPHTTPGTRIRAHGSVWHEPGRGLPSSSGTGRLRRP